MFFVISGFLLYRPFVVSVLAGRPTPRTVPFWRRRACRIFPAYWVALAVAVYVVGGTGVHSLGQTFTVFALLQNYRFGYHFLGLAVAWTLVVELSFYIVLPIFARLMQRLTARLTDARSRLNVQVAGVVVLAAAGLAFRAWYHSRGDVGSAARGAWFVPETAITWLPYFLDWFALGMAMAIGSAWLSVGGRIPKVVARLGRMPWLAWLLALACYWITVQLQLGVFASAMPGSDAQLFANWTLLGLAGAFFVVPAVFGSQSHGQVRRVLRARALVFLGVVSYGIYLWHVVVWDQAVERARIEPLHRGSRRVATPGPR